MLKAVKNYQYNKKNTATLGYSHLEEYVFDAFMPVYVPVCIYIP